VEGGKGKKQEREWRKGIYKAKFEDGIEIGSRTHSSRIESKMTISMRFDPTQRSRHRTPDARFPVQSLHPAIYCPGETVKPRSLYMYVTLRVLHPSNAKRQRRPRTNRHQTPILQIPVASSKRSRYLLLSITDPVCLSAIHLSLRLRLLAKLSKRCSFTIASSGGVSA
jgi:hypothetical protein